MFGEKVPSWESELWSYISRGDGMHCPLFDYCEVVESGSWCGHDSRKRIMKLLDDRRFHPGKYDELAKPSCRIFELVEILADEFVSKGEVHCLPVPIRLVWLADEQHGVEIHSLPLKVHHGAVWLPSYGWVIQLRADDTSATKRYTLLHETFHILAYRGSTQLIGKGKHTRGSFNELLADHFASCILAPRDWVKEKWAQVEDLGRMASIFDIPKPVVWIRLRGMGLI